MNKDLHDLLARLSERSVSLGRIPMTARTYGYCALYLLPIIVAVTFNYSYSYWLVSGLALPLLVFWLWGGNALVRVCAMLLNAVSVLGNFLLATSLYIQRTGFNDPFFYHLDIETISLAYSAYGWLFLGSVYYCIMLILYPVLLCRRVRADLPIWRGAALLASIGLLSYAPLLSLGQYGFTTWAKSLTATRVVVPPQRVDTKAPPPDAKNLVLIYAEGLEDTYRRADLVGHDLTPNLTLLEAEGMRFTGVEQVANTVWTTGGIIASQCALPIAIDYQSGGHNVLLATVDAPLPGVACLGDVLTAHGYASVFMGGTRLAFGGKGNFLAAHGFQVRHGYNSLRPRLTDPDYVSGWGIYDDSLLEFALEEIRQLENKPAPYVLAILTLDTHHPSGIPSASCGDPGKGNVEQMVYTIGCSDRFLADFIRTLRMEFPDLVVALLSDHLALDNDLFAQVKVPDEERRLRFVVWAPSAPPGQIEKPGTHFDIMPTVLDVLGFEAYAKHNYGASLRRFDSPWFTYENPESLAVATSLEDLKLKHGEEINFALQGPTIQVAGRRLLASNEGLALTDTAYIVDFNSDGDFEGMRLLRLSDGHRLYRFVINNRGRYLLGVSTNKAFNIQLLPDTPAKVVYFAGQVGADNFMAGPLWWRKTIKVADIL